MAQLQSTTITGTLTLPSYVAGFLKLNALGAVVMDTNTYITGITSGMVTTALGYTPVPNTRNITINGVTQDLSVDRTWTISAGVSSVSGSGAGISVSPTTGAVVVSNTGVTSNVAGTGISVSGATGAVTITNTGVTSIVAGTAISISGATGAVTINNAGVTSVNGGTGAITGIITTSNYNSYSPTLTGGGASGTWGISITGSATNSSTVGGISVNQIFNNMGNNHSTYTNFNDIPNFGVYYVQGTTNGPGTGSTQFYGFTLGLGNEYAYASYALQLAIPRDNGSDRYLSTRTREGGSWGSWYKINAGYADSAGNSVTTSQTNFSSLTVNSNTVLHAGNYNSYSPTLTGGGASGTWGINVTGTAGSTQTLALIGLGNGSVNVNNGNTSVYRTENGSGAALAYAPVLHLGGGDTMWQAQGTYGASGNGTLYFRQGYAGSWGNWLTMLSSANYNSYSPTLTGGGASGTWGINITGSAGSASTASQVTINYNNDSNSTYQMLWGSGNSVYGTAGVYVNPYDDRVYANYFSAYYYIDVYTSAGGDYLRINDNQVYRPGAGPLYLNWSSNGNVYATGPGGGNMGVGNNSPSYKLHVSGDIYANGGWLRVSGTSGLYFESYGGGWRMTDSSYVRIYNGKSVSMEGNSVDYVGSIYMNGGVYIQTHNNRNLQITSSGAGDNGIYGRGNSGQFCYQLYGNGSGSYGFLDGVWAAWDLRKAVDGALYMNDNDSYYLNTTSNSYVYRLEAAADLRAPIFYDSNNTGYYGDFASTSNLNGLNIVDGNLELYKDITVDMSGGAYSTSNYYPVIIGVPTSGVHIEIQNNLNSNVPSWSTHGAGFTINLRWFTNGSGWGTTQIQRTIYEYHERFANVQICGGISQLGTCSGEVVWLRGGGIYYFKVSRNVSVTPYSSNYTCYSETAAVTSSIVNDIWSSATGNISTSVLYANIIYDNNNPAYYLDPNSESNLWRFTAASMTRNAINYLSINSPYSTRAVQSSPYLNGTMGWGTTDFNTIGSYWGSGFIDTWSNPGNAPGGSSHYVGIQAMHYNDQNGNFHGWQMACAQEATNRWFWRSSWNVPNRPWVEMIHSGNIGSQSVNYASSAGNADTVDGFHAAAFPYRSGGSSGYYQVADWMQFNTSAGLYWPSYNGAHIYPNTSTSYGSIRIDGNRSGWRGIVFDGSVNLMMNDNETGHYKVGYGWQWRWYQGQMYISRGTYGGGTEYTVLDSGNYNSWAAAVNGNVSNTFNVLELSYNSTAFNPSAAPRTTMSSMSVKMWNNYFNGTGLGSDYGTVMQYYSLSGHVDSQVYFDAGGETWYRSSPYAGGWYSWRRYMTDSNSPYAWNMNQYVRTSDAPTFNGVYTNDWFRANGCTGLYFQTYGYGLRAPECEGNNYGNVCTYGGGRNGWAGYGITASFTMMGRSGTDVGLHDNGSSWIFYSPYGTQRLGFGTSTTSASYRIYVSGAIYATGDVVAYSDRRKKTDIVTIDNALEKVTNLRGVFYTKIGEEKKGRKTGVIAQEINEVLPEVVTYASDTDEYGVSYGNIAGVLIEAIKEQNELIKTLKSEIDQLKAKLE